MFYVPQLGEKNGKVLGAVLEQAMDGYTLQAKTGLTDAELSQSVQYLKDNELIGVEGNSRPETIRSVYVWVPPGIKGSAQLALRSVRSQQSKAS